ncbi:YuiB family protein [Gottfriedia luciferensis]|uniref:YuiB family protein n=1 Tax=Gottfriedia luciferensis TaxID=178774 RepID=UPI000B447B66|nr:YuiB family protein [Gottfriedia luciferensis]
MSIPVLLISILLFFVLAFGIGFLANMLFRTTWFMVVIYPLLIVMIVDKISTVNYFTHTAAALHTLKTNLLAVGTGDVIILTAGLVGAIMSGVVILSLRKNGYQMF